VTLAKLLTLAGEIVRRGRVGELIRAARLRQDDARLADGAGRVNRRGRPARDVTPANTPAAIKDFRDTL